MTKKISAKQKSEMSQVPVARWKRSISFLFDLLIFDMITSPAFGHLLANHIPKENAFSFLLSNPGNLADVLLIVITMATLSILYFTLFEYYLGQTPGKMLFHLETVTTKGNHLLLWQAIARNMFLLPIFPFSFLLVADGMFLLVKNKTLSEMITKTQTNVRSQWTNA